MKDKESDVTQLLRRWRDGDDEAADRLIAATYQEMRRRARGLFKHERVGHTLQATALVNEAFMRLFKGQPVSAASKEEFFNLVARRMRNQLVDHARRRKAIKRGSGAPRESVDDLADRIAAPKPSSRETLFDELDEALARMAASH